MKNSYYYDTEFLEGTQEKPLILKSRLGHWMIGKQNPTIDLISIGIVSGDDDREYYAISKEFNLKEAWNRFDEKVEVMSGDMRNRFPEGRKYKEYWIRENVLFPIYYELCLKDNSVSVHEYGNYNNFVGAIKSSNNYNYVYKNLERLIAKYGKSNKQIADELKEFVLPNVSYNSSSGHEITFKAWEFQKFDLYAYYGAYDHVALCWLFGKMIDLPDGFPMYTIDLKQMLDESLMREYSINNTSVTLLNSTLDAKYIIEIRALKTLDEKLKFIKKYCHQYPSETNAHNALSDAKFNKQLHQFIKSL